jgi:hypothetical protein
MKSALPLPRYVLRKPRKSGGWHYFFNAPMWARKAGCPVQNEPLGSDYHAAVERAESVLLKAFDAWQQRRHGCESGAGRELRDSRLAVCRVPERSPLH